MEHILPKKSSLIFTGVIFLLTGIFSNWLLFEIVLFVCALGVCVYGVIWPRKDLRENVVYFGYFWGMLLGLLAYPLWQATGVMQLLPLLMDQ